MHKQNISPFKKSYIGRRDDILSLIPDKTCKILDVGCSIGTLGEQIKQRNSGTDITGIELDKEMAEIAKLKLDRVIIGNVEELDLSSLFSAGYFDCVVFGDVLEHLKDPWCVLQDVTSYLSDDGVVISSIPNIRHYETILNLLFYGYWPYRDRGIHDRSHLRVFTLQSIEYLFMDAGLKIQTIKRKYRIIEKPHRLNKYSKYLAFPLLKEFITYQYLVVAVKESQQRTFI